MFSWLALLALVLGRAVFGRALGFGWLFLALGRPLSLELGIFFAQPRVFLTQSLQFRRN
jgi:hypothetical protein